MQEHENFSENIDSLIIPKGVHSYILCLHDPSEPSQRPPKKKINKNKEEKVEGGKEHSDPLLIQKVERKPKNPVDLQGDVLGCKGFHSILCSHKTGHVTQEYPSQRKHFQLRSNLANFGLLYA